MFIYSLSTLMIPATPPVRARGLGSGSGLAGLKFRVESISDPLKHLVTRTVREFSYLIK